MAAFIQARKLEKAVFKSDWDKAVGLIAGGAKPNEKTINLAIHQRHEEWSALMLSALTPMADSLFDVVVRADWDQAEPLFDAGAVPDDRTMNLVVRRLGADWLRHMINALVRAGKKPSSMALHIAFEQRSEVKADMLIAAGAVADAATLSKAAFQWTADAQWIKKLTAAGAPATSATLMEAMEFPDLGKIRALLKAGAVPDEQTMLAAILKLDDGKAEMLLDAMIEAGTKPTAEMLDTAACLERKSLAKVLIAHGAVPYEQTMLNVIDNYGAEWVGMFADAFVAAGGKLTPDMLSNAVVSGQGGTATELIARGAEISDSLRFYLVNKYGRDSRDIIKEFEKEAAVYKAKQAAPAYNKAAAKKQAKATAPRLVMGKKPKLVLRNTM